MYETQTTDLFGRWLQERQEKEYGEETAFLRSSAFHELTRTDGAPAFLLRPASPTRQWRTSTWYSVAAKGKWFGPGVANISTPLPYPFVVRLPGSRRAERWVQCGTPYYHFGFWLPYREVVNTAAVHVTDGDWTGTISEWCAIRDAWNVLGDDVRQHRGIG